MNPFSFPSFIAIRYSLPLFNQGMSRILSLVSIMSMALAVFALIMVSSVMNGFQEEIKNRLLSILPHAEVNLHQFERWQSLVQGVAEQDFVVSANPYIEETMLIRGRGEYIASTILAVPAVAISTDESFTHKSKALKHLLSPYLVAGQLESFEAAEYQIALGRLLARQLDVTVGDKVDLLVPKPKIGIFGAQFRQRSFTVAAVFEVGAEIDYTSAFVTLDNAQTLLFRGNDIDGFQLSYVTRNKSQHYNALLKTELNAELNREFKVDSETDKTIKIVDWREKNAALYHAIALEKRMIFILLFSIVIVASFSILSIILMSVTDKSRDISILKTMGASNQQVRHIFILQGLIVSTVGIALGTIPAVILAPSIGQVVSQLEQLFNWQLFDPSVYFIPFLPSELRMSEVGFITVSALLLSILVSIFPANRASNISPSL